MERSRQSVVPELAELLCISKNALRHFGNKIEMYSRTVFYKRLFFFILLPSMPKLYALSIYVFYIIILQKLVELCILYVYVISDKNITVTSEVILK